MNGQMATTPRPKLTQDPHATERRKEKSLELAIGREVRQLRKSQSITIAELAAQTELSVGMLSKLENGTTSASLTTLQNVANALRVPITAFFKSFEEMRGVMHVKAGEGLSVERVGTRAGHQYQLLGHIVNNSSGVTVEPYLIKLQAESDVFPTFQHEGTEFLYMIKGVVDYRHGDDIYRLEAGDSLIFDADAPHGPEKLIKLPAHYLSIISYPQ